MPIDHQLIGSPGLVALTVVREELFGDADKPSAFDDLLQKWIHSASKKFEAACGQPIRRKTMVHVPLVGNGRCEYTLSYHPVSRLVSLEREQTFDVWEAIVSGYVLRDDGGSGYWIRYDSGFTRDAIYRATFDVGYDTIPEDIETIVCDAVKLRYLDNPQHFGGGRLGISSRADAGAAGVKNITVSYSKEEFKEEWARIAASYERHLSF